jgi:hypothetical protein
MTAPQERTSKILMKLHFKYVKSQKIRYAEGKSNAVYLLAEETSLDSSRLPRRFPVLLSVWTPSLPAVGLAAGICLPDDRERESGTLTH